MSAIYRRMPGAHVQRVGEDSVLMLAGVPRAFVLNETAAVLWDALAHFERAEELASLLSEARPDLAPGEAAREVQSFLDSLVAEGLATRTGTLRVRKVPDIVTELVGSELIVLTRGNRKVHLLNDTGALLWEALDQFGEDGELRALLAEAWPDRAPEAIAEAVDGFLKSLLDLGLVEAVP